MKVYTTDGQVHEFRNVKIVRTDPNVLTITDDVGYPGYPTTLACFPLANVQRWEP